MKHIYLLILIAFCPLIFFGQTEYYTTETSETSGIKLIDGGEFINSQFCQVKIGDKITQFTPYDIKEFGFKDGRVYVSKEIQIDNTSKKVFLERLQQGNATLYYYNGKDVKTFYIQKDNDALIELPKINSASEDYSEQLLKLTKDCANVSNACKLASYNKKSLSYLIARYNDCELKPFPHLKYGLLAGFEFSKLTPSSKNSNNYTNHFDFNYSTGFTIGAFIDKPISDSNFSLRLEAFYSKFSDAGSKQLSNQDTDYMVNTSSLKMPLLIRYVYPSNTLRPFLNAGLIGVFNLTNDAILLETNITNNVIKIKDAEEKFIIDKNQFGFSFGGGVEYSLTYKSSVFFELRYDAVYSTTEPKDALNISSIKCITGINF